jgi:undecaprenyl-diphosphatase
VTALRSAGALVLFLAILAAIFVPPSHAFDVTVSRWLQRPGPALDIPAVLFVFLFNAEILIPAVALAGFVLWPRDHEGSTALWGLAVGLLATSVIAVGLKRFIPHPGPPVAFHWPPLHVGIDLRQPSGFPSGHTMRATYVAVSALRRVPLLAAAVVLAMMTALVYLGYHWPTEVLGGLCLGWACAEGARLLGDGLVGRSRRGS